MVQRWAVGLEPVCHIAYGALLWEKSSEVFASAVAPFQNDDLFQEFEDPCKPMRIYQAFIVIIDHIHCVNDKPIYKAKRSFLFWIWRL